MSFYEEACAARFAASEPLSVPWLARTTCRSDEYNDCDQARTALREFGAKRKAEAELLHVRAETKRVKSAFSGVEVPRVEIALVADENNPLYCVAPNATASQLWFLDAERSQQLMADAGEAGDAFRHNRGAKITLPDLKVATATDWAGGKESSSAKKDAGAAEKTTTTNATTTNAPAAKTTTKKATAEAKKLTSFFTAGAKPKEKKEKTSAPPKAPPPTKAPTPPEAEKTRRRIVDDDDEEEDEGEKTQALPSQENEEPPPPPPEGPRLVEKTFMDDKGYLVTHKVWEHPEHRAAQAPPPSRPPPPPKTKKPVLPKPKPKKAKPQPKGQTDVFSFFKKKA
mmetsp:Transcript_14281/g.43243  ORF Transcript_14281/g.43243 Transcript_14281/m.43243 type:complete len:340 (-) Transcript_14281:24-1043(-)|eukprot:CAMPEP_0198660856 /NCGR_PEP_ID=MMETSP1467-20131203/38945_1 /TAXON_ID=1462469 /ORGANISM="unid. sp., Strain CCMP2135" /LENGTH=339 /DNA_ID=CAMNT_0044397273 /DNA_START=39 /DNA_END=1058 /DNA_ORIENTATION=-